MKLKNVTIKRGLGLLEACAGRIVYFSRFGKGWKKAFERATADDLDWLSSALGEKVENYRHFKVLMEQELDVRREGSKKFPNGTVCYFLNGEYHRTDGPAIIWADGDEFYYQNGQRHREDGPAIIRTDGSKYYYQNGQRHREDGPAVIYPDGEEYYYLDGQLQ
jgi:hypothetical protein